MLLSFLKIIILPAKKPLRKLNISRPYLYTLLDNQEFPYILIGTHRRIKVEDVLAYKAKRDSERRQTLAELIEASQELGFYETEASDSQEKE